MSIISILSVIYVASVVVAAAALTFSIHKDITQRGVRDLTLFDLAVACVLAVFPVVNTFLAVWLSYSEFEEYAKSRVVFGKDD